MVGIGEYWWVLVGLVGIDGHRVYIVAHTYSFVSMV
jgi:hypothetical protein